MATVFSCGGFSAVCGSSIATAATMSKVAMPSMRRFGYDDRLATGSIAAGGTLGILIPPSVILIIYGLLTESNIGKLFIAGVVPDIRGVILYLIAVRVAGAVNPSLAPTEPMTRDEKLGVFGVLSLFLFIMVSIYGGFFTPTEAAGIGAGFAISIAVLLRSLSVSVFVHSVIDRSITTAMIFMIVMGAEIFTNFINFVGLPDALADFVIDMELSTWMVIFGIIVVYLLLGCVLDSLSMDLLKVPVFYPLMYGDYSDTPIWVHPY